MIIQEDCVEVLVLTEEEEARVWEKIYSVLDEVVLQGTAGSMEQLVKEFRSLADSANDIFNEVVGAVYRTIEVTRYLLSRTRTFHPRERFEKTCEGYPPLRVRPPPGDRRPVTPADNK